MDASRAATGMLEVLATCSQQRTEPGVRTTRCTAAEQERGHGPVHGSPRTPANHARQARAAAATSTAAAANLLALLLLPLAPQAPGPPPTRHVRFMMDSSRPSAMVMVRVGNSASTSAISLPRSPQPT
jgi:hypothetical protein